MSDTPEYFHVSFPAELIEGRVSTFYQSNYRLYVTDQDRSLRTMAKSRSTTAMLAGGAFLDRLAKGIPLFTVEELQGELGVKDPLNPNDARKHALLNTVQATVHVVQQAVDFLVDEMPSYLDGMLVAELKQRDTDHFPEIPRTLNDGQSVFQGVHLLYLPKGGSFQLPAGMILRYGPHSYGATTDTLVIAVLDLEDHPQRNDMLVLMKKIIAFRNSTIDAYTMDVLMPRMIEQVKAIVGEEQLDQFNDSASEASEALDSIALTNCTDEIGTVIANESDLASQMDAVATKMTLTVPDLQKQLAIWYMMDKRKSLNVEMNVRDYVRSVFEATLGPASTAKPN